ncbi:MAG: ATP-binding protein [Flavonifractor plautii]
MGCGRIATAHSADDNLETLSAPLGAGAGLHGLAGIPPRRGVVVRPLLTTSRAEIVAYLEANGVAHVEDSKQHRRGLRPQPHPPPGGAGAASAQSPPH